MPIKSKVKQPWRKGQSCVSNPAGSKHRQIARESAGYDFINPSDVMSTMTGRTKASRVSRATRVSKVSRASKAAHTFQKNNTQPVMKGGLTMDALKEHDIQVQKGTLEELENMKGSLEEMFEIVNRFKNSPTESHRHICAILQCVREVIIAENGKETETAYYANLINLLEQQKDNINNESTVIAIAYLLSLVTSRTPTNVLRQTFPRCSSVVIDTMNLYHESSNALLKSLCHTLQELLLAQDAEGWNHGKTKEVFGFFLQLSNESRPKLRKKAQDGIFRLLSQPPVEGETHPVAIAVAQEIKKRINKSNMTTDAPVVLHNLVLLQRIINFIPAHSLRELNSVLFKIFSSGNPFATKSCLDLWFFYCNSEQSSINNNLTLDIVLSLLDHKVNVNDADIYTLRMKTLTAGVIVLAKTNPEVTASKIPLIVKDFTNAFNENNNAVWAETVNCFEKLLTAIIPVMFEQMNDSNIRSTLAMFVKLFSFQYARAWPRCFETFGFLVEACGKNKTIELLETGIVQASQLYQADGFKDRDSLCKMMGKVVATIGIPALFKILPLEFSDEGELNRSWLLPVCAKYHRKTELAYFTAEIAPIILDMEARYVHLKNDSTKQKLCTYYRNLYKQFWSLLPGFCTLPTDGKSEFGNIAKVLGLTLKNNEEVRLVICQSLDVLISRHLELSKNKKASEDERKDAQAVINTIQLHAKNFIAVLFNCYLSTRKTCLLNTVSSFVSVCDENVVSEFGKQLLSKILTIVTAGERNEIKRLYALMDLLSALSPKLNNDVRSRYYATVTNLMKDGDGTLQKLAYAGVGKLCALEFEKDGEDSSFIANNWNQLCEDLVELAEDVHASAKKIRLRLLITLVPKFQSQQLSIIHEFLLEAVMSTKEVNETTRKLGYELLIQIAHRFMKGQEQQETFVRVDGNTTLATLAEYFQMVLGHLAGTTSHLISATITSLGRLLYEFSSVLSEQEMYNLLTTVFQTLQVSSQEILKASLGFVKVSMAALTTEQFSVYVKDLVTTIMNWETSIKFHFRMKIKMILERCIRKYGYDYIESLIPESDHKLIVAIRKNKERSLRNRNKAKDDSNISDDEDFDSMMNDDNENNNGDGDSDGNDNKFIEGKTWIQEDEDNTVDFLDPNVVKQLVSTNPNAKKKENTWDKFNKSGKMLIEEEDSDVDDKNMDAESSDSDIEDKPIHGKRRLDDFEARPGYGNESLKRKKKAESKHQNKRAKGEKQVGPKLEPFSFIPFQKADMNKRNRNKNSTNKEIFKKVKGKGVRKSAHKGH